MTLTPAGQDNFLTVSSLISFVHYDLLTTKYDLRPLVNIKGRLFHKATRSPTKKKKQNKTKQKLVKSLLLIRTAEMAVQLTHFKGIILI